MNIARRLLEDLEEEIKLGFLFRSHLSHERINSIIKKLHEWVDKHEKMFDHSKFIGNKDEVKEWLTYHDQLMEVKKK